MGGGRPVIRAWLVISVLGSAAGTAGGVLAYQPPAREVAVSPAAGADGRWKIVERFDRDGDGRLDAQEREQAREYLRTQPPRGRRGVQARPPADPGARVAVEDAPVFPGRPLHDPAVLRTLFLEFEGEGWEAELSDFHGTDVEVPAVLTLDGVRYPGVGVRFRGHSSYFMIPPGHKRSLNIDADHGVPGQRVVGHAALNLLNSSADPSFLSTVLYSRLAREHIPAPAANHVRVVINGESWGIFVSAEQFDRRFVEAHFGARRAARWKASGSPDGCAGLTYAGDDPAAYRRLYEMKAGGEQDWQALIDLCRTLSLAPLDELPGALRGRLDVDGVLWFLALDVGLVNADGYWARASDYSLCRDAEGVFHLVPHDMNEAFPMEVRAPERPGHESDPRHLPGPELDPFIACDDPAKPLYSRLLMVPEFRSQFARNLRTLGAALAWESFGPLIAGHRGLILEQVRADTKKLSTFEEFDVATADAVPALPAEGLRPPHSLRAFAERRSRYLLSHPEIALPAAPGRAAAAAEDR